MYAKWQLKQSNIVETVNWLTQNLYKYSTGNVCVKTIDSALSEVLATGLFQENELK